MYTGGMLCQDCHGNMTQVGNDFSTNMPGGSFIVKSDFYTNSITPRVPWANEPGCGSCHIGAAKDNGRTGLNTTGDFTVNVRDKYGNTDNLRLLQAFTSTSYCAPGTDPTACPKVTPIVPRNKRFAEDTIVDGGIPTEAPGGNPKLYRVSNGHSGVYCEACHGSTHAEWPNANPNANDNKTAIQLQGHSGKLIECDVCHKPGRLGLTLNGPDGMDPIDRNWNLRHEGIAERNRNSCRACHGQRGEGTVLSRTAADRTLLLDDDGGRHTAVQGHRS